MNVIIDDTKPGLEVLFKEGEQIPMKGIWFRIAKVDKASMTLLPVSMTNKRRKEVQGGHRA